METLQDFVSARFAELTAATGLTEWARQARSAVTSAASTVRGAAMPASDSAHRVSAQPVLAEPVLARPGHVLVGHDLPLITPGVERC